MDEKCQETAKKCGEMRNFAAKRLVKIYIGFPRKTGKGPLHSGGSLWYAFTCSFLPILFFCKQTVR